MTISPAAMEKLTDPVTSEESELEEGEIASDEIEIITEVIRKPKPQLARGTRPTPKPPQAKDRVVISRSSSSSSVRQVKFTRQSSDSKGGRVVKLDGGSKKANITNKKGPSKDKVNSGNQSRRVQPRSPVKNASRSSTKDSVKRRRTEQPVLCRSSTVKENSSEFAKGMKWKRSFELVSCCSVESMDTGPDSDEEMELRLAALNSVVNGKPKDVADGEDVAQTALESEGAQDEEDEDEELLRAQLLIEVARKQTKELETASSPESVKPPEPVIEPIKPPQQPARNTSRPVHIPIADRLVIDLRNDSSDDSEDDGVEDSVDALLKSTRQLVEEKSTAAIPQSLSHLPLNQQEEYQRLKQEIIRREKMRMVPESIQPSSPATTELNTIQVLPVEIKESQDAVNEAKNEKVVEARLPLAVVASHRLDSANQSTSKPIESQKVPVLKQQLLLKKRDLATTKSTLTNQLELVDKNRALWLKSSQEVTRFKTMLLAAEENERQLRNQLTNSQHHTQRMKTKMQSLERQINVLIKGIGVNRTRKISAKTRPKPASVFSYVAPTRVKPKIVAKALASGAATSVIDVKMPKQLPTVQLHKTLHDEQWLYGTLGDDWNDSELSVTDFPIWTPHGHASKFV